MLRGKKMHHIPHPLLLARRRGVKVFFLIPLSFARSYGVHTSLKNPL